MTATVRARATLLAVTLAGCGGNAELGPAPAPSTTTVDAGPIAPPSAPTPRTLVQRGLFGDSAVANLVLDPTFDSGTAGVGRWAVNLFAQPPSVVQQAILSDAPTGVGLPAGVFQDAPASGSPGKITLTTQVPGGVGPFEIGLWISVDPRENQPVATSLVTVTFAQLWSDAGAPSKISVPLAAERTRVVGARTWYRYEAEAPGPNPIGSLLTITLKASRYRWYLLAPEVVPATVAAASASATAQPRKLARPASRPLEAEDVERMRAYRGQRFPSVPPSALPRRQRAMP